MTDVFNNAKVVHFLLKKSKIYAPGPVLVFNSLKKI